MNTQVLEHPGRQFPQAILRTVRLLAGEVVHTRSSRVTALVFAVGAISLADLYLTLTFLSGPGMNEGNPLARWIIGLGSPWLLALWKVMLLAITSFALFLTRRSRTGEIATWVCLGVMIWLAGQWMKYAERAPLLTPLVGQVADVHTHGHDWVRFETPEAQ